MRVRFGDLIQSIESGFACSKAKHVAQGIPHLRPFNIGTSGELDLSDVYQVPEAEAPSAKIGLSAGDLLFNNTNSADLVGKTAIVTTDIAAGFSNHITRIKCDTTRIAPRFAAAYLSYLWRKGYFRLNCTQWVSQAAVNSRALRALEFPLPPLPEQRRAVDILSRADGIRRLRREAQEKARQLIPALFVEMFGDPASNPKGWPIAVIRNLLRENLNYGTMRKGSPAGGQWLDLRVANIQGGMLDLADLKWIDLPEKDIQRHSVKDGDLLVARAIASRDHLGKCVVVYPGYRKWAFDSHLMRVRLKPTVVNPEYVKYLLHTSGGRGLFLSRSRASAVQFNINTREFASIAIPIAPIDVQNSFAERVSDIQAMIAQQDRMAADAERLQAALMARLFDGGPPAGAGRAA